MHKRSRKKRNNNIKKISFLGLIAILIVLSIFGVKLIAKNKSSNTDGVNSDLSKGEASESGYPSPPSIDHKDLGNIESIIEYGSNGLIGAHYPVFNKSNIDEINKSLVTEYIKKFKDSQSNKSQAEDSKEYELSIDYKTYSAPNNIISVSFDIIESGSYLAHPDVKIKTKIYDLSKDKEIGLSDILSGEYLEYISQISKNYFSSDENYRDNVDSSLFMEGIYPSETNYSHFILKENKIAFLFEKYQLFSGYFGAPTVEILYSDLKDYIRSDFFQIPVINESSIEEEKDNEKPATDIITHKRVVDPNKPMIALTFDDGPNQLTTVPILNVLKKYNSVGTFFILGNRVSYNVSILEQMLEEGSEIGNHSYNHKELTKLSSKELAEQITRTQDAVIKYTGATPKLLRPTYGSYNEQLKSKAGMPLILWSIDTLDWKYKDAKKVADHVLEHVKDGDIILMHDIYESTSQAVEILVPELIDMGYQLVTVSELFKARGEVPKDGHIYNRIGKK